MDSETFFKNRKVFLLYSAMITCIIVGLFLHYGKIMFFSEEVSKLLSTLFILSGYYLVLIIAKRLKKKNIHGLTAMAWATLLLFHLGSPSSLQGIWWKITEAITTVVLVFCLVDGAIRFVMSLFFTIKASITSEEKTVDSVDTVVAVLTSLLAIIISIIELF